MHGATKKFIKIFTCHTQYFTLQLEGNTFWISPATHCDWTWVYSYSNYV